jgi:protein SCO1/2
MAQVLVVGAAPVGLRICTTFCIALFLLSAPTYPGAATPQTASPIISGFYLPSVLPLAPFELVDHHGKPFTLAQLQGQWTLLSFGYTHCPDVCPTTLSELRAVRKHLKSDKTAPNIRVVFVTLDPDRDTPSMLGEYLSQFDREFLGVSGSVAALAAFTEQLRVKYAKAAGAGSNYLLDHSSSVALITPQGRLRALFSTPLRSAKVASDIRHIRDMED